MRARAPFVEFAEEGPPDTEEEMIVHPLDEWTDPARAHDVCSSVSNSAVHAHASSATEHCADVDVELVVSSADDNARPL